MVATRQQQGVALAGRADARAAPGTLPRCRSGVAAVLTLTLLGAALVGCRPMRPGTLVGTVRGPDGSALSGMQVALHAGNADPTPLATQETGSDGTYDFGVLPGGHYRLGVTDPGHVYRDHWHATARDLATSALVPVDEATTTIDVRLVTPDMLGSLRGFVRAPDPGAPAPPTTVTLYNAEVGNAVASTTSADDGSYAFADLEPAAYKVGYTDPAGAFAPQFWPSRLSLAAADPLVVAPSGEASADTTLVAAGGITGLVSDGVIGLPTLSVLVLSESAPGFFRGATTDSTGRYTVTGLAPGTYVIGVFDPAWFADPATGFRPATIGTPFQLDQVGATRFTVTSTQTTVADVVLGGAACDPATFHAGASLDGAALAGLRLSACDLSAASLRGAAAHGADLHAADLRGADLRDADLSGADLTHARLAGADLTGADISGARFGGATFDHTRCPTGTEATTPQTCGRRIATITASFVPAKVTARLPFDATVTVHPEEGGPTPTGQLSFMDPPETVSLSDGSYQRTGITAPDVGTYPMRLDYAGDENYEPASVVVTLTVVLGREPYVGEGTTVGMAGDSITFWAKPVLDRSLAAAGFRYSVSGWPGIETLSGKELIDDYAATVPDIFIVDLGANDAGNIARDVPGFTIELFEARMAAFAAQFPQACVVVTTISAHRTAATHPAWERHNATARTLNDWLHANFTNVIEWEDAVAAGEASGTPILADEVHPNEAGEAVLANLVTDAATRCATGVAPAMGNPAGVALGAAAPAAAAATLPSQPQGAP